MTTTTPIDPADLPAVILAYLTAHRSRDAVAASSACTDDAVVDDDGHTYRGRAEIQAWIRDAAAEYDYTATLTAATRTDDTRYVALHHLEGNFPGGTVDLQYRFTLRGDLIARLVIEPSPDDRR
ncbi:nuclear transport factor 2 family protein [Dactylosporangium sp. NPDC005555]|uniref:nuclear transport factor 2 family protein n=1 Tax=Dactylosporangium sp. NPDC005555 TaxID=3154889 RepID=UPI0033B37BC0